MIILNKAANYSRSIRKGFGREVLLRIEPSQHFAINQKHALQNAVLPHQIFRWTDLGFFFAPSLFRFRATQQSRSYQGCATENDAAPEKTSASSNAFVLRSILHVLTRLCLIGESSPSSLMSVSEKKTSAEFTAA